MPLSRKWIGRGVFSLLELSVIVVILGVVAAIVIPRMSRAAPASPHQADQVLVGELRLLRAALDDYAAQHAGHYPAGDVTRITQQLTGYTDWSGDTSATRTTRHNLGPYLREIPPLPVGARRGGAIIGIDSLTQAAWRYNPATGQIRANTDERECDADGRPYSSY